MLLKLIRCDVAAERQEAFSSGQRAWAGVADCDGFLSQGGGWSEGQAWLTCWWRDWASYANFRKNAHDHLLARSVPLLIGLAEVALDASVFGLLPLLLAWQVLRGGADRFMLVLGLGLLAFLLAVYAASTMHLGRHLDTSAHRLVLQWVPLLAVLLARTPAHRER